MSDDYERMMQWASGSGVSATPQPVSSVAGLRGWEMNQPALVSGAGGMPYGVGDYGSSTVAPPTAAPWSRGVFNSTRTGPNGEQLQEQGWGMPAMGAASGIFNAWLGMKQYGLAKNQLAEGKRQFGMNYDAQRRTTNASLEDRQRARVGGSAPGTYQSVGDYMAKNAIQGG